MVRPVAMCDREPNSNVYVDLRLYYLTCLQSESHWMSLSTVIFSRSIDRNGDSDNNVSAIDNKPVSLILLSEPTARSRHSIRIAVAAVEPLRMRKGLVIII